MRHTFANYFGTAKVNVSDFCPRTTNQKYKRAAKSAIWSASELLKMKFLLSLIAIACLTIAFSPFGFAQSTTASLKGQAFDQQSAAVAHASVELVNTGTGFKINGLTNAEGEYLFPIVPPGEYTLTVEAPGFKKYQQSGIRLTIGQSAAVNVNLATGDVQQTVTVVGDTVLINTTTAEVSQLVDKSSIQELPLNGRDPASLVLLSPGTTNIALTGAGYNQSFSGFANAQGASANGGKQGSTYYMLDGVPNNDIYQGLAAPFPNADATQEFKVVTNNFDAQYGFSPSAVVAIQTRTGSNSIHGELFEFVRNNDLNAADYFSKQVATLKRNQFGGSVGGPILHNKLFYFANYQGTREVYANSAQFDATPTAAMLTGDFSAISSPIIDPTTGLAFPGNKIPLNRLNQNSLNLAKTFPVAPPGSNGDFYVTQPNTGDSYHEATGRLDYDTGSRNRVSLRYFSNFFHQPGNTGNGNLFASIPEEQTHYLNFLLSDTWTISPTLINVANVYASTENALEIPDQKDSSGKPICLSRYSPGITEPAGDCNIQGLYIFGVSGWEYIYQIDNAVRRSTRGFGDTLIKTVKRHTFTAGGTFLRNFDQDSSDWESIAQVEYYGAATGFGIADFVLGAPSFFTQGGGEYGAVRGWQLGAFAQDQFQIRPNLTLNFGVRWEPNLAPAIQSGRAASYIPGEKSVMFTGAPVGAVFAGDPGVGNGIFSANYNRFQPRLGIAWQPKKLPNTSIRSAFGLFSEPYPLSNYNHMYDDAPFSPTYNVYSDYKGYPGGGINTNVISFDHPWTNSGINGGVTPFPPFSSASYVPAKNVAFGLPLGTLVTFDPKLKPPTVQSWNLSVSQQLRKDISLEVTYVGIETYHDSVQMEQNPGLYYGAGNSQNGNRKNSNFSSVQMTTSGGTTSYNALQAHIQKNMSHGLQAGSSFTWSRTIDDSAFSSITFASNGQGVANPFNLRANRDEAAINIPLISVTNFVYTTPTFGSNALVKNTLGGWEVSGIVTLQSGIPFSISWANGGNNSYSQVKLDRADLTGKPLNVKQGGRNQWLKQYYNPAAFQINAPGTFGTSSRNLMHAPGITTADMSVGKNWKFAERYRLQFRWEAFNAFNHASYGTPVAYASQSSAGRITSSGAIPARLMQGALKLYF